MHSIEARRLQEQTLSSRLYLIVAKSQGNCRIASTMLHVIQKQGEVAEWTKAAVLKTVGGQPPGGSNPSLSANQLFLFGLSNSSN